MKKGISPLIGTVLLIAATMTIAGLLAFWASSYVQSQTQYFTNRTQAFYCSEMVDRVSVISCKYEEVENSTKLLLIVDNKGKFDLKGFWLILRNDTYIKNYKSNETLYAGLLTTLIFENVENITGKEIRLRAVECPEVDIKIEKCEIA